jgi:mono/diheme cytochrome c family protein
VPRTYLSVFWIAALTAVAAGGCSKKAEDKPPPAETETTSSTTPPPATGGDPVAKAKDIFRNRCVPCHGALGQGDGPASATLNPKPRKYADPEWQASVTDEYIEKIIKYGGAAVGKSPAMPNNPDLSDPAVVAALKDIVRGFNPKK